MVSRVSLLLITAVLALPACGGGGETETTGDESTGGEAGATLVLQAEALALCTASIDRLEFATRRVDCWDPELPCTLPAMPFWVTGTTRSCADLDGGGLRWEVTVTGSGQYETQLRALTEGGDQEGVSCYAAGADDLTRVTRSEIEASTELFVSEISDTQCSNP